MNYSIRSFSYIFVITALTLTLFSTTDVFASKDHKKQMEEAKRSFFLYSPDSLNRSIEIYEQILREDPNNAEAYAGLAESYSLLGNYNFKLKRDYDEYFIKAHENIHKALRIDSSNRNVKKALAYIYLDLSRERDADRVASEILKKYPGDVEAQYISWASNGRNADDPAIQRILRSNPDLIRAHVDYAESLMYRKRSYTRAAEQVNNAIRVHESPMLRNLLGIVYMSHYAHDRAIEEFKRAIRLDPNFGYAYMNYGISLYYKNQYGNSIEMLNRSISLNPRFPESYFFLGRIYQRQGDKASSDRNYGQFIRLAAGESRYHVMVNTARESMNRN